MARTTSSGSGFVSLCHPLLSESASKLGVAGLGIVNSPGKVLFSCGALEQALQEVCQRRCALCHAMRVCMG